MKLCTIQKVDELNIRGVEFVKVNDCIRSVIIRQAGDELHIGSNYGIEVSLRRTVEPVDKFRVFGALLNLPVDELFESEYEAKQRLAQLEGGQLDSHLEIEPVVAYIDEAGTIRNIVSKKDN